MKEVCVYTALQTACAAQALQGHITTSFSVITGKVPKFESLGVEHLMKFKCIVKEIVYWEHVGLTVALVDSPDSHKRFEQLKQLGFKYEHEFVPHITIGKGDLVEEHQALVGVKVFIVGEYMGHIVRDAE